MYNRENVFYKIINKHLPADVVYEDDFVIAFKDISPVAPIHILLLPKKSYIDLSHFLSEASEELITIYFTSIEKIVNLLNIESYRIISNKGDESGQTVPHFHTHIISGKKLNLLVAD